MRSLQESDAQRQKVQRWVPGPGAGVGMGGCCSPGAEVPFCETVRALGMGCTASVPIFNTNGLYT